VHGEDSQVPLLGPGNLPQVVEALLTAIRDAPHIAEKVRRGGWSWFLLLKLQAVTGSSGARLCSTVQAPAGWGVHAAAHLALGHASPAHLPGPKLTTNHLSSCPALQVCYAISQLAAGFYEQSGTSAMSPYFKDIVQALLETVRHPHAGPSAGLCSG